MAGFDYEHARLTAARHAASGWPLPKVIALIAEHEKGTGFTQMSRILSGGWGRTTKNACIGKAHRLGLPKRGNVVGKDFETARAKALARRRATFEAKMSALGRTRLPSGVLSRAKAAKPGVLAEPRPPRSDKVPTAAVREALALPALHQGLISGLAATQCKWPVGDPKDPDFGFCGRLKREGGPYCTAHHGAACTGLPKERVQTEDRPRARAFATNRFGAWA